MTDSPDPVVARSNLTYTVTVTNGGPATATDDARAPPAGRHVRVGDDEPGSAARATGRAPRRRADLCFGALAPGASATVTTVVTPSRDGTITNTATARASQPDAGLPRTTLRARRPPSCRAREAPCVPAAEGSPATPACTIVLEQNVRFARRSLSMTSSSRVIFQSPLFALGEFRCPPASPLWNARNLIGSTPHVVFPRTSVSIAHAGGRPFSHELQPRRLLQRGSGVRARVARPPRRPLRLRLARRGVRDRRARELSVHEPVQGRHAYLLQHAAVRALQDARPDVLAVEEAIVSAVGDRSASRCRFTAVALGTIARAAVAVCARRERQVVVDRALHGERHTERRRASAAHVSGSISRGLPRRDRIRPARVPEPSSLAHGARHDRRGRGALHRRAQAGPQQPQSLHAGVHACVRHDAVVAPSQRSS